jgi:hypothetical protein
VISEFVRIGIAGMEARGEAIKSDTGIRDFFRKQVTERPELDKWVDMFPTAPPDAVAGWLHGDKGSMNYYPRSDELATVIEMRPA